jgi:hypothetical protein
MKLAELWWSIASDETRRDRDRLEASKLLADRGWGKTPTFEPLEGDPLDLAVLEAAAEEFRASVHGVPRGPYQIELTSVIVGPVDERDHRRCGCSHSRVLEFSSRPRLLVILGEVYKSR